MLKILLKINVKRNNGVSNFPKGDFPSANFPIGNFPNVQFSKRELSKGLVRPFGAALAALWTVAKKAMKPIAEKRIYLGSCRLGNCTVGKVPLGKIPTGSCRWGKYQREVAAWEKVFGKLSTIKLLHCS